MAFTVTLYQMVIFLLILSIGFFAGKKGIIARGYLPELSKLITTLVSLVLPNDRGSRILPHAGSGEAFAGSASALPPPSTDSVF